jgi:hypothetical protein
VDEIALIDKHDAEAKPLSPAGRLRLHEEQSAPVMARLKDWMQFQFDENKVEPNSALGKAINQSLKCWES